MNRDMCCHVLALGTDKTGKGGIATVIKHMSDVMSPFHYVCVHKFGSSWQKMIVIIKAIFQTLYYVIFRGIKVLHIHSASYTSFYVSSIFVVIGKAFRKKVVLHLHGGKFFEFYKTRPKFIQRVCLMADCLVGVSRYFVDRFMEYGLNSNVRLLYNPIEIPSECLVSQIGSRRQKQLAFLGAIDDNKGIFDLVERFGQDKAYFEERVQLFIAGVGQHERLLQLIEKYDIGSFVHYLGWIGPAEKAELLSHTDIYLQPSRFESLGISIIEAMSYGVPVIASRTGGIPEVVDDGINGLLFTPHDFDQCIVLLKQLLENDARNKALGLKSREKAKLFSLQNFETELSEIYRSLRY